jgi:carbon storage regulator
VLVLSRRLDETICIGENIRVKVVDFKPGGVVRLGVDAPDNVVIMRQELLPENKMDLQKPHHLERRSNKITN